MPKEDLKDLEILRGEISVLREELLRAHVPSEQEQIAAAYEYFPWAQRHGRTPAPDEWALIKAAENYEDYL